MVEFVMSIYLPGERQKQRNILEAGRIKWGVGKLGLIGLEVAVVVETAVNATKPLEVRKQKVVSCRRE